MNTFYWSNNQENWITFHGDTARKVRTFTKIFEKSRIKSAPHSTISQVICAYFNNAGNLPIATTLLNKCN